MLVFPRKHETDVFDVPGQPGGDVGAIVGRVVGAVGAVVAVGLIIAYFCSRRRKRHADGANDTVRFSPAGNYRGFVRPTPAQRPPSVILRPIVNRPRRIIRRELNIRITNEEIIYE